MIASIAASVVSVGASSSRRERQHPGDVDRDVAAPTTTARSPERSNASSWKSGWPLYQATNSVAGHEPGQVLAGDAQPPVGLRADRVDDRVVEPRELVVREVAADLDVAEEAEARLRGDLLERARDGLDLRVVGRDAEPDEPPRRRQPLDHVDLDREVARRAARRRRRSRPGRSRRRRRAEVTARPGALREQPEPQPHRPQPCASAAASSSTWNEWPQPHADGDVRVLDLEAGLLEAVEEVDLAPWRYGALNGSTTTVTPCASSSWSPSWAPRSKPSAYSKPEQPPPWTATRSTSASPAGSSACSSLIFAAARSVSDRRWAALRRLPWPHRSSGQASKRRNGPTL